MTLSHLVTVILESKMSLNQECTVLYFVHSGPFKTVINRSCKIHFQKTRPRGHRTIYLFFKDIILLFILWVWKRHKWMGRWFCLSFMIRTFFELYIIWVFTLGHSKHYDRKYRNCVQKLRLFFFVNYSIHK